jgi:hypothetical protein
LVHTLRLTNTQMAAAAPALVTMLGGIAVREFGGSVLNHAVSGMTTWLSSSSTEPNTIPKVKAAARDLIPWIQLEYLPARLEDYHKSMRKTKARDQLMADFANVKKEIEKACYELRRKIYFYQRPWFRQNYFGLGMTLDCSAELYKLRQLRERFDKLEAQDIKLPRGDLPVEGGSNSTESKEVLVVSQPQDAQLQGLKHQEAQPQDPAGVIGCESREGVMMKVEQPEIEKGAAQNPPQKEGEQGPSITATIEELKLDLDS